MSITDADRLAYNNLPTIELADGRKLPLHYGFGGIRRLEASFGSLTTFVKDFGDGEGAVFDVLFRGLHAGLWQTRITEEDLEASLDPGKLKEYGEALGAALNLAFPQQAQEEKASEADETPTSPSTGPAMPTSQQPSSDSPSVSSGN